MLETLVSLSFLKRIIIIFSCGGSLLLCGLFSLVGMSRGLFSSCGTRASCCSGFSRCGAQAPGAWASVAAVHRLSSWGSQAPEHRLIEVGCMGLVAPQHVVSFQTRDRTCVYCIGRWILYH